LIIWQAVPEYFSEQRLTSDGRCLPSYDLVSREVLRDTAF
jgi:hypothetical protein